jgi:glyoxylase-like metal-dependent hydrolase (beta-lactamase superfamily II)
MQPALNLERRRLGRRLAALGLALACPLARSSAGEPELTATEVAEGVYAVIGATGEAAPENGGRVGNSGFLVGAGGTIVVNTGSSYAHGRQLIELAERSGGRPVVLAVLLQPLQEFVMGSAAFAERGIPVLAHAAAARLVTARCDTCLVNLKRLLGEEALRGTRVLRPTQTLAASQTRRVAGRALRLWHPGWATTPGDLVLIDEASGIAFAGALVSVHRIPELRDADLAGWRRALDALERLPVRRLVPGYGPVTDLGALAPQRAYFDALERQARTLLESGASLLDAAQDPELPAYADWDLYARAHPRNLQQTYLRLEAAGVGR